MQPAVINIFEKAVKKAGKILLRDFGELENLQIQSKSVGDFVTNADIKVEKTLLETLKYYYPDYTYITEETGEIKGDENTIIIDPIDGTSNFIHGIPHVGIIVAKMTNDEITDGVIYNPILNEFFWSSKGRSAGLDLAYVASGKLDGFWEKDLNLWDVSTGILLVKEAGGKISKIDGNAWEINSRDLVASNNKIHNELVKKLTLL